MRFPDLADPMTVLDQLDELIDLVLANRAPPLVDHVEARHGLHLPWLISNIILRSVDFYFREMLSEILTLFCERGRPLVRKLAELVGLRLAAVTWPVAQVWYLDLPLLLVFCWVARINVVDNS